MKTPWLGIAFPTLALLLAAAPAYAQTPQNPPAQTVAKAPVASPPKIVGPGGLGDADTAWLQQADREYLLEYEMSQAAEKKAQAKPVRAFARTLVQEHRRITDDLREIARANEVLLPERLDPAQQRTLVHLQSLSGAAFDTAYLQAIRQANQTDIATEHKEFLIARDRALHEFLQRKQMADRKVSQSMSQLQSSQTASNKD